MAPLVNLCDGDLALRVGKIFKSASIDVSKTQYSAEELTASLVAELAPFQRKTPDW